MSLNQDSVSQETIIGDDTYVRALLNDGWRWSAAGDPQVIYWAADTGWTPLQVQTLATIFASYAAVANVTFVQVTNTADAEIVIHQTTGNQIGNFGGYSGTPGETDPASATPVTFDDVTIADHGQVHTYLATDGFLISGQPTFIPNPDAGDAPIRRSSPMPASSSSLMNWATRLAEASVRWRRRGQQHHLPRCHAQ